MSRPLFCPGLLILLGRTSLKGGLAAHTTVALARRAQAMTRECAGARVHGLVFVSLAADVVLLRRGPRPPRGGSVSTILTRFSTFIDAYIPFAKRHDACLFRKPSLTTIVWVFRKCAGLYLQHAHPADRRRVSAAGMRVGAALRGLELLI